MRKNALKEPCKLTSTESHKTLIKVTRERLLRDLRDNTGRMSSLEVLTEPIEVAITTIDNGGGILSSAGALYCICDKSVLITNLPGILYNHRKVCSIGSKDSRKMKVLGLSTDRFVLSFEQLAHINESRK